MPVATANRAMLTRREAAELVRVPLGALDKAIEQKVVRAYRRRDRTWLRSDDIGVIVLLQKTALPLPVVVKRKIRRWVRDTEPYRAGHEPEFAIGDALIIRWTPEMTKALEAVESYATLRDQWIGDAARPVDRDEPRHQGWRAGHLRHAHHRSRGRGTPRRWRHSRDTHRGVPHHPCGGFPDRLHVRPSASPSRTTRQAMAGATPGATEHPERAANHRDAESAEV